jgi:hypothetical protein
VTLLYGQLIDQVALISVLNLLHDLRLTILSVEEAVSPVLDHEVKAHKQQRSEQSETPGLENPDQGTRG